MYPSYDKAISFFKEICGIPHGTYHIDEISDYLVKFAKDRNLTYRQDDLKNVIIWKPATAGYEEEPAIMLQGHMDMVAVCDNPGEKDMLKEGLDLACEDGYLYAKNTSLGADDGIALGYALAILDAEDIEHPPLIAVFTVNEEVGMDGALGIDLSDCDATRLLNIDSEEEGVITVSCAGGVRLHTVLTGATEEVTAPCVFLSLEGLTGGHSGTEIHKGRANAAHLLTDILERISEEYDLRLISVYAGEKDNAIPNGGSAEFFITDMGDRDGFMEFVEALEDELKEKYAGIEENLSLFAGIQLPQTGETLTEDDSDRFLEYLTEVPDGVIRMCEDIDMVQTSLNLGILRLAGNVMTADYALRSSVGEEKKELVERLTRIADAYEGNTSAFGDYPAWEYVKESPFREKAVNVFRSLYGRDPVVTGVHAGLECGILAEKVEGLEAISIGPNIKDIHTTKEKLDLKSAERTWTYILKLLEKQC